MTTAIGNGAWYNDAAGSKKMTRDVRTNHYLTRTHERIENKYFDNQHYRYYYLLVTQAA